MDRSVSSLTDQQRDLLKQFRSNLTDMLTPDHTDVILLKFLRAKNFNLKKAEINFREDHWTRLTYEFYTVFDNFVMSEVFKYRADTFLGFAKDGSPIRYVSGKCDIYGFLQSASIYVLARFFCYVMECDIKAMKEENMRTGKNINEITYIIDLAEFSILQFTHKPVVEIGFEIIRLFQDHFPERWGNIFFVNTPLIFDKVFILFKPIVRGPLAEKMKVATKNGTAELLRQYIDDDVLPTFLGGKRVDSKGDIYCKEFINQSEKVPEKYYLRNCIHYIDETDPGVKVVTIGARSVFNVPLVAREKGGKYRLEMRTEGGSIHFSILYREFGTDPDNPDVPESDEHLDPHDENCNVSLVGTRLRVQCHIAPTDGWGAVINPGIYILQFDNTNSWFTSRKLFYRTALYQSADLS